MLDRPDPLFERVVSPDQLAIAWARVRSNGGGPGGDGQTIAGFSANHGLRIERLSADLRSGFYRPGPLRHVKIDKPIGGKRRLSIPSIIDRIAQSAAAMVLSEHLEPYFEPESYGYRPGRSVKQAVARVAAMRRAGFTWVVDADIRAFFDNVDHRLLLRRLELHEVGPKLCGLIALWLESFAPDGKGLAQGSPVSPVLANLHLDELDEAMRGEGLRLVRFADDFVVMARSRKKATDALEHAVAVLRELGLELNSEKTRLVPFEDAFTFLGKKFFRSMVLEADEAEIPGAPDPTLPERDAPAPARARGRHRAQAAEPVHDEVPGWEEVAGTSDRAPLYVVEPGRHLVPAGEGLAVREDGEEILRLPMRLLNRVEVGPRVIIHPDAIRLALAHELPVFLLDGYGAPMGELASGPDRGDAGLHMAQARAALDPDHAARIARAIVATRARNQRTQLKRLSRRLRRAEKKGDHDAAARVEVIDRTCGSLLGIGRKVGLAKTVDSARGDEGNAGRLYWPALAQCLDHGWALPTRDRRGAKNPVSIILDWTASILTRDMRAAVLRARLHPGFGTLHATRSRSEACVYDLVEAFRAPLCEGLTIYLFNNRILSMDDFGDDPRGLRVQGGGGKRLIREYERAVARRVIDKRTGVERSWRGMMLADARAYARSLREGATFEPYETDY